MPGKTSDKDKAVEKVEPNSPRIVTLCLQLGSALPQRRREAERSLRDLGPKVIDVLLPLLEKERRGTPLMRIKQQIRDTLRPQSLLIMLIGSLFFGWICGWGNIWIFVVGQILAALASGAVIRSTMLYGAADLLATFEDLRVIGPLAELLPQLRKVEESVRYGKVQEALARLLPQLREGDGNHLNGYQRECLLKEIDDQRSIRTFDLQKAILEAFIILQDNRALTRAKAFIRGAPTSTFNAALAEVAARYVQQTEARMERSHQSVTLLRAASGEEKTHLLRPAGSREPSEQTILLRSVASEEPENPA